MASLNECPICGKTLSSFRKTTMCDAACRQAKARLKRETGKKTLAAKAAIRALIKATDLDLIEWYEGLQTRNELTDVIDELERALNRRYERQFPEA